MIERRAVALFLLVYIACSALAQAAGPQDVASNLDREIERLSGEMYIQYGNVALSSLTPSEQRYIQIEMQGGVPHAIVVACGPDCDRVVVRLFDGMRKEVAVSLGDQNVAIINGVPMNSGLHEVTVAVPGCKISQCEIGLVVLRQDLRSSPTRAYAPLSPAHEEALTGGATFKECEVCPEVVVVPAGEFLMGSPITEEGRHSDEGPLTKAYVTKPFAVGKFEVTRDEYEAFVKESGFEVARGCRIWNANLNAWDLRMAMTYRYPGFPQTGKHPVVCVSWDDTQAYVEWLHHKTGKPYRLLSEAEWEYVARAGSTTPFWWGSTIKTDQANYDGRTVYGSSPKGVWRQTTVPVDSFEPNPFGLYNVHGNVWEWVEDCYFSDTYQAIAKAVRDNKEVAVRECMADAHAFRGGSWLDDPDYLRSARRVWQRPGGRYNYLGFRVARTL
jgi:formylglycine-generating enzyme required for sulfatase activity